MMFFVKVLDLSEKKEMRGWCHESRKEDFTVF
jgi:hypothetical protein